MTELPPLDNPVASPVTPPRPHTSATAIVSLICGILSFCTAGVSGVVGLVLGVAAVVVIRRSGGMKKGAGLAVAGIATSLVGILVWLAAAGLVYVVIPRFEHQRHMASATDATDSRRAEEVLDSLMTLTAAADAYVAEHDGRLPQADEFPAALEKYLPAEASALPKAPKGRRFVMNVALSGVKRDDLVDADVTVLFFLGSGSGPAAGDRRLARPIGGRGSVFPVAFADGTVQLLPEKDLDGLLWDLKPPPPAAPLNPITPVRYRERGFPSPRPAIILMTSHVNGAPWTSN